MKKYDLFFYALLSMFIFFINNTAVNASEWRSPFGYTFIVDGFEELIDIYENNMKKENPSSFTEISQLTSGGITYNQYYQFDNGLGIGFNIGPLMMIIGDAEFFDLPLGLDLRLSLIQKANISPYFRLGYRQHLATGDYVEGTNPGLMGGFGIEFSRKRAVGFGFEVSIDESEIELTDKVTPGIRKIQNNKLMFSLFAIF